jgi:DNA-directed RNA polymerase specialized sigma24 family protein
MAGDSMAGPKLAIPGRQAGRDMRTTADEAVAKLYNEQARPLLGIAALLVCLTVKPETPLTVSAIAEEIVHDSFAAVHREWRRLRDADRAVTHLRRCTVRGTRLLRDHAPLRGRITDPADVPAPVPASPDGGVSVPSAQVLSALRGLPGWQREALVLRYYADLPEEQAAAAMGVTRAAFRGHAIRGMTALRRILECGLSTA